MLSVAWQSDPKLVGQQIKKIRKQKHMTQDALAEELGGGCTNKTISRYETGKVEMGIQTLFDVAEALEVPVDKLVPDRLQVHMEEEEKSRRELLAIVGSLGTEDVEALLMVARRFEVPQRKAVNRAVAAARFCFCERESLQICRFWQSIITFWGNEKGR